MGPISFLMEHAGDFGYVAIIPHPRPKAPQEFVRVIETNINPNERFGTIEYITSGNERGMEYQHGDVIQHENSGAILAVVENLGLSEGGFKRCRVQAIGQPITDDDKTAWTIGNGKGNWVCIARAYSDWSEIPNLDPANMTTVDIADQKMRQEYFKHPERSPWAQNFTVARKFDKLPKKKKRLLRAQLRSLLGQGKLLQHMGNIESVMDMNAQIERNLASGGRVVKWRVNTDKPDE